MLNSNSGLRILGVIPSRYASVRFPGKPLALIAGQSMIARVYFQALKALSLSKVVVATDDDTIFNHVQGFGGTAVMTSPHHKSGTERCLETVQTLEKMGETYDIIVNIQGDEPFISPSQIDLVAACFSNPDAHIATLAAPLNALADVNNPHVVKLVKDSNNKALYFSRHAIPYNRNNAGDEFLTGLYLKHIGIYAYRSHALKEIAILPPSPLETTEMLEQLRWLENGYSIYVNYTESAGVAIDTPEDLAKAEAYFINHTIE